MLCYNVKFKIELDSCKIDNVKVEGVWYEIGPFLFSLTACFYPVCRFSLALIFP